MSTSFVIASILIYFFATRIIGSFLLNLVGPPIDDHQDGWVHLAMWVPVVGELGFLFLVAAVMCIICVEIVNRRTALLAQAIKRRLKSE